MDEKRIGQTSFEVRFLRFPEGIGGILPKRSIEVYDHHARATEPVRAIDPKGRQFQRQHGSGAVADLRQSLVSSCNPPISSESDIGILSSTSQKTKGFGANQCPGTVE